MLGVAKKKSASRDQGVDQLTQILRQVFGRENINVTTQGMWVSLYTEMVAAMGLPKIASLPSCSEERCKNIGREDGNPLELCGRCRGVRYCSKACQTRYVVIL